jgi:hypothetical protein
MTHKIVTTTGDVRTTTITLHEPPNQPIKKTGKEQEYRALGIDKNESKNSDFDKNTIPE